MSNPEGLPPADPLPDLESAPIGDDATDAAIESSTASFTPMDLPLPDLEFAPAEPAEPVAEDPNQDDPVALEASDGSHPILEELTQEVGSVEPVAALPDADSFVVSTAAGESTAPVLAAESPEGSLDSADTPSVETITFSVVPVETPDSHVRPGLLAKPMRKSSPDVWIIGQWRGCIGDHRSLRRDPPAARRHGPAVVPRQEGNGHVGQPKPAAQVPRASAARGVALVSFRRLDEAIHLFNQAISLRPRFAEAHRDLGAPSWRGDLDGAIASLKRACNCVPALPGLGHLGDAYQLEGQIGQAIRCYRRLLELVPRRQSPQQHAVVDELRSAFQRQHVFHEHLRWAERHADPLCREIKPYPNDRSPDRRLKIGYVSPDFRRHSVNYFTEPVLAGHYRPDFHVTCYSDVVRPDGVTRAGRHER